MLEIIINAFTKGNLVGLKSKLLHSTSWAQHNVKAYGENKLQRIIVDWLTLVGRSEVLSQNVIRQGDNCVISINLKPIDTEQTVSYLLWLETNGNVIKSIYAIADTEQIRQIKSLSAEQIMSALPQPDAFELPDYDQQDHLQGDLATPSNIANRDHDFLKLLDHWWAIWSKFQLSAIEQMYSGNAEIELPGKQNKCSHSELFDFVLSIASKLDRPFAQLEHVILENNNAAIKWHLDGDLTGNKVRLPFITLLTLNDGKIISEQTTCDIWAFNKRFSESQLFDSLVP